MAATVGKVSSMISRKFNWRINNFSKLDAEAYSKVFSVGTSKWNACICPKGDGQVYDHLSLFLIPKGRFFTPVEAKVSFAVTSQTDPNIRVTMGIVSEKEYKFDEVNNGYGWDKFMKLSELHDPAKGYLVDDTCVIGVEVTCETEAE